MASDLSNAAQVASAITESVAHAVSSSLPADMNTISSEVATQGSYSWLGLFGWFIWFILNVVSTILYWVIRIATITLPTFLFTLFSTSWTVTMNATTLYATRITLTHLIY